jgi:hypothetical protein
MGNSKNQQRRVSLTKLGLAKRTSMVAVNEIIL